MSKDFLEVLKKRRSVRNYKDKEIPHETLKEIIEAGRCAPSGMNRQDFRFTVISDSKIKNKLTEVLRILLKDPDYNGFYNAPVYVLISAPESNSNGLADCSCAAVNIMNAASFMGIGSVWVNQLKNKCHEKELRDILNSVSVPIDHVVWAAVSLGYASQEKPELRENISEVTYW